MRLMSYILLLSSNSFASDFMRDYIDETSKIEEQRLSSSQKESESIKKERIELARELKQLLAKEKTSRATKKLQTEKKKLSKQVNARKKELNKLWTSYEEQLSVLKSLWLDSEIAFFYPKLEKRVNLLSEKSINSDSLEELIAISERSILIAASLEKSEVEYFDTKNTRQKAKAWHIGLLSFFTKDSYLHYSKDIKALQVWPKLSSSKDWDEMKNLSKIKNLDFDISSGSLISI